MGKAGATETDASLEVSTRRTRATPRSALTRFIGREAVLKDLLALTESARLINVVGPPGIGKTRAAHQLLRSFSHEAAVWCDLRSVTTASGMAERLAECIDGHLEGALQSDITSSAVADLLIAQNRRLIVLDNFEQLVAAGTPTLLQWLQEVSECCFVLTSRQVLQVRCETVFELPPLELASTDERLSEAATLFLERAKAIEPALDSSSRPYVEALVGHLEGMPLAIELAASRVRELHPRTLLEELRKGPTIRLEAPERDIEPRHRSLRAAIESSWAMLRPAERAALSQLTVCRKGFSAEAVEAVVDLNQFENPPNTNSVIRKLREASLIHVSRESTRKGHLRWDMYEAIREYAMSFPRGEAPERHARYYADLGRHWASKIGSPDEAAARSALTEEIENMQAALEYATGQQSRDERTLCDLALSLFAAHQFARPGSAIGPLTLALDRLTRERGALRSQLLLARATCRREVGAVAEGLTDFAAARTARDHLSECTATIDYEEGLLEFYRGNIHAARTLLERAAEEALQRGASQLEARARRALGNVLTEGFQDAGAWPHFQRALQLTKVTGDRRQELLVRAAIAGFRIFQELHQSFDELAALAAQARKLNDTGAEIFVEEATGLLHLDQGDFRKSRIHLERALELCRTSGHQRYLACVRFWLAALAESEGPPTAEDSDDGLLANRFQRIADHRNEAFARVQASFRTAKKGLVHDARKQLAAGKRLGNRSGDRGLTAFVEVQGARVDLADSIRQQQARQTARARALQSRAAERVAGVRRAAVVGGAGTDPRPPITRGSPEVRWALRLYDRAVAATDLCRQELQIVHDGRGFRLGNGPPVSLPNGSVVANALSLLGESRLRSPGGAVGNDDFFTHCWPGERVSRQVASQRIRQTVARLRKSGLGAVLKRNPSGYLLDPDISVTLVDNV